MAANDMKVPHRFLLMFGLILLSAKATSQPPSASCLRRCGSIDIPYPFGTSLGCAYSSSFILTCNKTLNSQKLFFRESNDSTLNISPDDSELRVEGPVARDCYNQQGNSTTDSSEKLMTAIWKFPLSTKQNIFVGVGCDTLATIVSSVGSNGEKFNPEVCYSSCPQNEELKNGSCSGIGCCQKNNISNEVYGFALYVVSVYNHSKVAPYKQCGYGFVVEDLAYNFSIVDLKNFQRETVPVVLDWAVGNLTCKQADQNRTSFACKAKSRCLDSTNGPGYRCKCLDGYEGNPYLDDGCNGKYLTPNSNYDLFVGS